MANTYVSYTGLAGQTDFDFSFPYLFASDLHVYVEGTEADDGDWDLIDVDPTSGGTVQFDSAQEGNTVLIKRITDVSSLAVVFEDPGTLTDDDLNTALKQAVYRMQELNEEFEDVEAYVEAVVLDSGNLPGPEGLINNFVVANEDAWATKTVAQVKTILGLGTAALVDTGTESDEVPTNGDLGTAALVDTGTESDEVPTNGDLGTAATRDTGTADGEIPVLSDVGGVVKLPAVDGSLLTGVAGGTTVRVYHDAGTDDGGDGSAGSWTTRTLDTLEDDDSIASLATNTLTLPTGKYHVTGYAVAYGVYGHQARLNIGSGTEYLYGSSGFSSDVSGTNPRPTNNASAINGVVILTESTDITLEHFIRGSGGDGTDFGYADTGILNNRYASLTFRKLG